MPRESIALEPSTTYVYPQKVSVVCPKCGHLSAFPFAGTDGTVVEYAGVCGALVAPRQWCDLVLDVHVTSHMLPA
jgi:hypothetical protein